LRAPGTSSFSCGYNKPIASAAVLSVLASAASASLLDTFRRTPCKILMNFYNAMNVVVPTLVFIMMTYGAIRYAYGADDPGGRKTGKSIFIQAMVGGLLYLLYTAVMTLLFKAPPTCPTT